jgi:hypothetical protein
MTEEIHTCYFCDEKMKLEPNKIDYFCKDCVCYEIIFTSIAPTYEFAVVHNQKQYWFYFALETQYFQVAWQGKVIYRTKGFPPITPKNAHLKLPMILTFL